MKKAYVWDLPTRVFHWSLTLLICFSLYTGMSGGFVEMDYHMLSGYSILTLVLFRVLWGLVGSHNARFSSFIKGPSTIISYAKAIRAPSAKPAIGHNPLGALSILAMLIALAVQAGTGLFANDDIMLEGPLVHLVSHNTSRSITGFHKLNVWIVAVLVGLHIAAIIYYHVVRKENLVVPMITGRKVVDGEVDAERNNYLLAMVLLGLASSAVWYLVTYV